MTMRDKLFTSEVEESYERNHQLAKSNEEGENLTQAKREKETERGIKNS